MVEVGSRAIRLLVADVVGQRMKTVATRVEDVHLLQITALDEISMKRELSTVADIIVRFREEARRFGAERIVVIATEAIRKIEQHEVFKRSVLPGAIDEVLSARKEAMCSLVASSMCLSEIRVKYNRILVVDQGAGSMEIAYGNSKPSIEMTEYASSSLGGSILLKMLRECGRDIDVFRAEILPLMEQNPISPGDVDRIVVQGTVATKCAWLTVRKAKSERYDPKRVHGTKVATKQLELIIGFIQKFGRDRDPASKWAEFQEFVNPGERGGDAGERVAAGIVPLVHLLNRLGKSDFVVSGYGTRHGMACLLAAESGSNEPAPVSILK